MFRGKLAAVTLSDVSLVWRSFLKRSEAQLLNDPLLVLDTERGQMGTWLSRKCLLFFLLYIDLCNLIRLFLHRGDPCLRIFKLYSRFAYHFISLYLLALENGKNITLSWLFLPSCMLCFHIHDPSTAAKFKGRKLDYVCFGAVFLHHS